MVAQVNPPISYWEDALLTTSHVLNQVPSKFISSTPYELWNNQKPDPSNLQPWGSVAYVHNPFHKYGKLGHRGRICIFIRYSEHFKEYAFIDEHEDGTVTELELWDVTFLEDDFPCTSEIDRDLHLYEMMNLNIRFTPEQQLMLKSSGSELVLVASTVKESMLRKSSQ